MAEDKITHDQISDNDPFIKVTEGAIRAEASVKELLVSVKGVTKELAKGIGGDPKTLKNLKDDTEAIRKLNAAYELHNLLLKKQQTLITLINAKREEAAARVLTAEQKVTDAINKSATAEKIANEKIRQEVEKTSRVKTSAANQDKVEQEKVEQQKIKTALAALKLSDAEKKSAAATQKDTEKKKKALEAYAQLSARHRELVREAKNLAVAYGAESKEAKNAAAQANILDKQLKKIDASVGQHQRNVGNYKQAWMGVQNALSTVGISLGVGAVFQGLKGSVEAFVEAEKNARALEFALKNVAKEGTAAYESLIKQSEDLQASGGIYSDDDIQKSQTMLLNFGLLSDEVERSIPVIMDYAAATGRTMEEATDVFIKGVNGKTKALKETGIAFEDTGDAAKNYELTLEGMTKFEGAAADAATTTEGKYLVLQNRFDDLKEDIGEFLINGASGFLDFWDVLTSDLTLADLAFQNLQERMGQFADKSTQVRVESLVDLPKEEQIKTLYDDITVFQLKYQQVQKDFEKGLITEEVREKESERMNAMIVATQKAIEELQAPGPESFNSRVGNIEKEKKAAEEVEYTWEDALKEIAEFEAKMDADERRRHEERIKRDKHRFELKKRQLEEEQKKLDSIQKVRERVEATHYDLITSNTKKRLDEINALEKKRISDLDYLHDRGLIGEKDYQEELTRIQKDATNKRIAIQLEEIATELEKYNEAISESLDRRFDLRQDELSREGDMLDQELQRQSERQLAGLDNTYAEVSRLRDENIAKQEAVEEARRRKEEAADMAELFIELAKGYAKDGDTNAAMKAFAETIAIRALSNTIAGNFAEGVENFNGKGTETSDSNLIGFSKGESVLTAKGTRETAGLATAVNERGYEGAVDWAMDNIYRPVFASAIPEDSPVFKGKQTDWMQSAMLNKLTDVEKAIKEKPTTDFGFDKVEKAFYTLHRQAGKTTKTIHRRF